MDKFHTEPKTWGELFEYLNYTEIEDSINKLVMDLTPKEK